ncbi:hypothetical protein TNCV_1000431 [Trichonephila clavipes]|nr:hypothetical protein TNCV_1000431 [Trichonephila clavipes]
MLLSIGFADGGDCRCPVAVQHDASQKGNAIFAAVLTFTMGDYTYAKNADILYMYDRANGNGRAALRMCNRQLPDRRMLDHRTFQQLHS